MDFSMSSGLGFNKTNSIVFNNAKADNIKAALNKSNATDEELMEACKSFEAYLLEQAFKGMEKTIIKDEENQNEYLTQFSDSLYEEYAKEATKAQGIGLAQMLYESMKRNA
jgi:flagellar protein FlgJ